MKYSKIIGISIIIIITISLNSYADDLTLQGRTALGFRISNVDYSGDSYSVYGYDVDVEIDNAVMFGVNYTGFVTDFFSIEASADYVKTDTDLSSGGLSGKAGELTQIPIFLSFRLSPPNKFRVVPFIGGGVGFFINDFDQNDETIEYIYGSGAKVEVENSLGYFVSGGLEIFITNHVALNFDAKYIWNDIDVGVSTPGFNDETLESNMVVIGGGLKYFFE